MGAAAIVAGVLGAASVGASIAGQKAAQDQAKKAAAQARRQAAEQAAANERAINAANQKKPDIMALASRNLAQNTGGIGSTMLTGPGGAPSGTLSLGRNTLLGQ